MKIIPRPKAKIKTFFDNIFLKLERKPFIIKLLEFNKNVIINGPSNVYEFIYQYIYVKPFIWFCGKHLSNNFEERPLTFYVIVFVLPKLVIVLTLFIDVTFFNQIHYFYNSLILYLIPLVFRIILYIINHHAKGYLDLLHEFFSFKLVNNYTELEITNIIFIDKIKLRQQENLLPYAETDWMPLQWMYSITTKINQEKDKYNNITNMIIYGLFTLSFLIYLLKTMGFSFV